MSSDTNRSTEWYSKALWSVRDEALGIRPGENQDGYVGESVFGRIFLLPFYYHENRKAGRPEIPGMTDACRSAEDLLGTLTNALSAPLEKKKLTSFCMKAVTGRDSERRYSKNTFYHSPEQFLFCFYRENSGDEDSDSRKRLFSLLIDCYTLLLERIFPEDDSDDLKNRLREAEARSKTFLHQLWLRENDERYASNRQRLALLLFDLLLTGAIESRFSQNHFEDGKDTVYNRAFSVLENSSDTSPARMVMLPENDFSLILRLCMGRDLSLEDCRQLYDLLTKQDRLPLRRETVERLSDRVKEYTEKAMQASLRDLDDIKLQDESLSWQKLLRNCKALADRAQPPLS